MKVGYSPPSISYAEQMGLSATRPKHFFYLLAILLISAIYGWVLAGLPLDVFKDRQNYLVYADQSFFILLGNYARGVLTALTNEPVWLVINAGLGTVLEPEATLRIIIGVPASIVAFLVLRADPRNFVWLLVFLLLPQIIKNHIVHLRQGLAVSFFLFGWFSNSRYFRWFWLLLTPLIHASFFFVLAVLSLSIFLRKMRLGVDIRNLLFCAAGAGTGLILGSLTQFLGARQAATYDFTSTQVTGLGFVFWMMVLFVMLLQGHKFMRQQAFSLAVLMFYLSTYFMIEVTARIFESSLLILLLAGLQMNGWRRYAFIYMIVGYGLLSYFLRLDQPWLGFAFT